MDKQTGRSRHKHKPGKYANLALVLRVLVIALIFSVAAHSDEYQEFTLPDPKGENYGPQYAPVTIDFWFNTRRISSFRELERNLRTLQQRHPRRLRVRYFPTYHRATQVLGYAAVKAAQTGKLRPFLDEIYKLSYYPKKEEIAKAFTALGFTEQEIMLEEARLRQPLEKNLEILQKRGHGVPALFVNGKLISSPTSAKLSRLEAAYDAAYNGDDILDPGAVYYLGQGVPIHKLHGSLAKREELKFSLGGTNAIRRPKPDAKNQSPRPSTLPPRIAHRPHPKAKIDVHLICNLSNSGFRRCSSALRTLLSIPDINLSVHALIPQKKELSTFRPLEVFCADKYRIEYILVNPRYRRGVLQFPPSLQKNANAFEHCMNQKKLPRNWQSSKKLQDQYETTPAIAIGPTLYTQSLSAANIQAIITSLFAPGVLGRWGDPTLWGLD